MAFQSVYREKEEKKSTGLIFISAFWECFPLVRYSTYSSRLSARFYYQSKARWDLTRQHSYYHYTTSLRLSFHHNHEDIYPRYQKLDSCEDRRNQRSQSHLFQKKKKKKEKTKRISIGIMLTPSKRQAWCLWQNKQTYKQTKQNKKTKQTKNNQNKTQFKL